MAGIEFDYEGTKLRFASKAKLDEWCDWHIERFAGVMTSDQRSDDAARLFHHLKRE